MPNEGVKLVRRCDPKAPVELPRPTLERLPVYHRVIAAAVEAGEDYISSAELGRRLQIDEAQVRRDLSIVWGKGKPGLGYEAAELLQCLEDVLGFNNLSDAVLVGAGRLGLALYHYPGFQTYGIDIVAVFDSDPAKIGTLLNPGDKYSSDHQVVLPLDKLGDLIRRMRIQLGVVTVPADQAQGVVNIMVEAGIKAIWNFAPVTLVVPAGVMVRNEDLVVGLATLQYHLAQKMDIKSRGPEH
ncbi:MAG TPA: redox-sensing transcriptional repressor Rex [Firmicutes bacterium]|jgi:redox-sensing transcriptional repressor|nr:redox-sensing transcriptional repressor Rex [Bacillota bacterium]